MTAVLSELRRLEAARRRGDLDAQEYARIKADIVTAVEDAELIEHRGPPKATVPQVQVGHIAIFIVLVLVAVTGLATLLLGDLTMALTISGTLLAAVTVHAFRKLEDE
ncbi:MAG: SHOCT domain-containing protein [Paracoccaceae bacterium]